MYSYACSRRCSGSMAMRHLAVAYDATGGAVPASVYADGRAAVPRDGRQDDERQAIPGATFVAIYEFDGYRPVVHESAFVHPLAAVTGNVVIGRDVYVGPGAAIRGDWRSCSTGKTARYATFASR